MTASKVDRGMCSSAVGTVGLPQHQQDKELVVIAVDVVVVGREMVASRKEEDMMQPVVVVSYH